MNLRAWIADAAAALAAWAVLLTVALAGVLGAGHAIAAALSVWIAS